MDKDELATIRIFNGMSDEKLSEWAALFTVSEVLMNERLTKQDDFAYSIIVILSGSVDVKVGDEVVNQLEAGNHFGEVALLKHQKRNATVIAREATRVGKLMTWDFEKFLAVDPLIKERLEEAATARLNW